MTNEERHLIECPLKEGYVRVYDDHTGRWFRDYSSEEIDAINNDPFMKILNEEITKEINREIIEQIKKDVI